MAQNKTSIFTCQITSLYNLLVTDAVPEGGGRHPKHNIVIFIKQERKDWETVQEASRLQQPPLIGVNS